MKMAANILNQLPFPWVLGYLNQSIKLDISRIKETLHADDYKSGIQKTLFPRKFSPVSIDVL